MPRYPRHDPALPALVRRVEAIEARLNRTKQDNRLLCAASLAFSTEGSGWEAPCELLAGHIVKHECTLQIAHDDYVVRWRS